MIPNLTDSIRILADLSEIARYSRNYGTGSSQVILISVVVTFALLWAGIYFIDKLMRPRASTGSVLKSVRDQLSEALNLSPRDLSLIEQASKAANLKCLEAVFVDPDALLLLVEQGRAPRMEIITLMKKLFGEHRVETLLNDPV